MKVIILAAGEGQRLRPMTLERPKCLVEYNGIPLLDYILDRFKMFNEKDIIVVGGYKIDVLKDHLKGTEIKVYENTNYSKTNMVETLMCARDEMEDDIIITYSDIIYSNDIVDSVINSEYGFALAVDINWRELWTKRFDNPLDDAETLKMDDKFRLNEIGKKTSSYDDIDAQYMGIMKIKRNTLQEALHIYDNLDRKRLYDGKDFPNMYMTSLIQELADNGFDIRCVPISSSWMEFDSVEDLKISIDINPPEAERGDF